MIVLVRGKPVTLTQETIAATRQWFADNSIACIAEAQLYVDTDGRQGFYVNDLASYVEWQEDLARQSLDGDGDHTFAFVQRAVAHQTGECIPLLSH